MSFSESRHEESFNNLSVYIHNLRQTNPHAYTHIKTDLMDRFETCFMAIGWIVHAFIGCFLPVILIGNVPLRREYLKTMFIAVAINENNQTLNIAFVLVVENNLYCCIWFVIRLRKALRQDNVVSSCIEHVFPKFLSLCVQVYVHKRRLWQNITTFVLDDIQLIYQNFRRLTPDAREMLANIGHAKWERAYFPNIRWNVVNINVPLFCVIGKST
uniref:Uncharacterized protein n=1 Tax=Lactuca sativa TaxID=4236 RepID=A0A9R1WZI9_LACSA|nr:hypothetical protein LSAT_V11C700351690 [Lactuca sativa]